MKKIYTLFILSFIGVSGIFTSCSEDYDGPDPVDVTANYSNKYTSHSNLALSYSGAELIGKSIDFSTVKGKTADITLYDIFPGEETLKLSSIPLTGDDNGYSFSGSGNGNITGVTFNYAGRVEKGLLTIDLTSIKMSNSSQWARTYVNNPMEYGRGKDIVYDDATDGYIWGESDNVILKAPLYTDMDVELTGEEAGNNMFLYANITGPIRGLGSYLLAQVINSVTLEADGTILAEYSTDEMLLGDQKFCEIDMNNEESMQAVMGFVMSKLFGGVTQDDIAQVTTEIGRTYTTSPRGLVYWYMKNGLLYVKLDLPAVITQVMQDQGKQVDKNLIGTLTDAIIQSDPSQLQQLLIKVNQELDNSLLGMLANMSNADFQALFSYIKVGIPMHIEQASECTHTYVERDVLTPLVNLLPNLQPTLEAMPMGSMLYDLYLSPFMKGWPHFKKLNIGLDLMTKSNQ